MSDSTLNTTHCSQIHNIQKEYNYATILLLPNVTTCTLFILSGCGLHDVSVMDYNK